MSASVCIQHWQITSHARGTDLQFWRTCPRLESGALVCILVPGKRPRLHFATITESASRLPMTPER